MKPRVALTFQPQTGADVFTDDEKVVMAEGIQRYVLLDDGAEVEVLLVLGVTRRGGHAVVSTTVLVQTEETQFIQSFLTQCDDEDAVQAELLRCGERIGETVRASET